MYSGAFGLDQAKLPIRLGFEAAGVVAAVGDDAHGPAGPVEAGDEVIAYRVLGGQASPIVVPAFAAQAVDAVVRPSKRVDAHRGHRLACPPPLDW